jgi:nitrate reductase NapE component
MILIAQSIILSAIGVVTQSLSTISALIRIRLIYFVLCVIVAAPIMLIALIGYGAGYQIWMNVGLVAIVATLLLYAKESIELFISKKVSILHWILYLCAVEILPFTLVWQIATRLR